MSWNIDPFVGHANDIVGHAFAVSEGAPPINDREQKIIEGLEKVLKEMVPEIGGYLSVSCYGSMSQVPAPGDTIAIYISYVADPASTGGVPSPAPTAPQEQAMTSQQALAEQQQEANVSSTRPGESEGLNVAPSPAPGEASLPRQEKPAAPLTSDEQAQLAAEEQQLHGVTQEASQLAGQQPQVTQQQAGQTQSLETGAGIGPDEAQARLAAQLAENPVQPKPRYWPEPETPIDASVWPTADVVAANGAILYNYANDQPGGPPTYQGAEWHVYEGQTQPAPGTAAASIQAQGAPTG